MDRGGVSCSLSFCGIMKKSIMEVLEWGWVWDENFHFRGLKDVFWSYLESCEDERYEYTCMLVSKEIAAAPETLL
mgnify:CR=1 FL=1